MKPFASRPLWPSGLVTTTSTAPVERAGVVAVIDVALAAVTPVAAVPPKVTVAPDANPVPMIVTAVPPLFEPLVGEIDVGAGGGAVGPVPSEHAATKATQKTTPNKQAKTRERASRGTRPAGLESE